MPSDNGKVGSDIPPTPGGRKPLASVTELEGKRGPRLENARRVLRELGHVYRQQWLGRLPPDEARARVFTLQTLLSAHRDVVIEDEVEKLEAVAGLRGGT